LLESYLQPIGQFNARQVNSSLSSSLDSCGKRDTKAETLIMSESIKNEFGKKDSGGLKHEGQCSGQCLSYKKTKTDEQLSFSDACDLSKAKSLEN
jgi:hypothetical protein